MIEDTHQEHEPFNPEAWLRRANSDLSLARLAAASEDVLREDALFHAQQCAEKAIKAVLLKLAGQFPFSHDLDLLIERLSDIAVQLPEYVLNGGDLSQYAVQTRYPGDWEPVSKGEMGEKIAQAAKILDWAHTLLEN